MCLIPGRRCGCLLLRVEPYIRRTPVLLQPSLCLYMPFMLCGYTNKYQVPGSIYQESGTNMQHAHYEGKPIASMYSFSNVLDYQALCYYWCSIVVLLL